MKKTLFFALLCAGVLSSCGDDDKKKEVAPNPQLKMLVKTIRRSGANFANESVTTWQYQYNRLVTQFDNNGNYRDYTYDDGNIVSIESYLSTGLLLSKEVFFYDSQDVMTTSQVLGATTGEKSTYTYNADGTISITTTVGTAQTQTVPNSTGMIFFEEGEAARVEVYFNGLDESYDYGYDDKFKPTKNIAGYSRFANAFSRQRERKGIEHNITSEIFTSGPTVKTVTRTYQYDAEGYPTQMINTSTDANDTYKIEYLYEMRDMPVDQ